MKENIKEFKQKRKERENNRLYIKGINTCNNLDDARVIGYFSKYEDVKIKAKIGELGPNEKISCMNDAAFKALIANSRYPERLARFLSTFLDASYDYLLHELMFSKNEFNRMTINSKGYRGDCVIVIGNNILAIEVNKIWAEDRNIRYLDSLATTPLLLGEEIGPSSCTLVNINYFTYENHPETVEMYPLKNDKGELLTFCKVIINIYVPNILKKYYNKEELSDLERVVLIFVMTNMKAAMSLAKGDEVMMEFIEDSKLKEQDEIFVAGYNKYLEENNYPMVEIYDEGFDNGHGLGLEQGKKQGIEQGIEQGKKQTLCGIVKAMLNKGHNLTDISDTLEISESEVKNYAKMNI